MVVSGSSLRVGWFQPVIFSINQKPLDYENEREPDLVSSQKIWLGLGAALRVAGLGRNRGFCDFAGHTGCALASRRAFRPLDCVRHCIGGRPDYHMPRERREAALAMGKGLAVA